MGESSRMHFVDSHTGGEPTRVILTGGPQLGTGPLADLCSRFGRDFDHYRSAICNEPRASEAMVGALLVPPHAADCVAGVIFFNNTGMLGMCGHGTIGLMVTLHQQGIIGLGTHRIDTPVGVIEATLQSPNRVSLRNVPAWRHATRVAVEVPGYGRMHGDIAWGGNWFFLIEDHGQDLNAGSVGELITCTTAIRHALQANGIVGALGAELDHIELIGPSKAADARNFVLCPGMEYDRSPCGTGTSAKLACLHAEGKLQPGEKWRQESIIGSIFEGVLEEHEGQLCPRISGEAWVCAEGELLLDTSDPFCWGIRK